MHRKKQNSVNRLTISLDFDETFTADPEFWLGFIKSAQVRGHRIICVTARYDSLGNREELEKAINSDVEHMSIDIFFASHTSKRQPIFRTENASKKDNWPTQGRRNRSH